MSEQLIRLAESHVPRTNPQPTIELVADGVVIAHRSNGLCTAYVDTASVRISGKPSGEFTDVRMGDLLTCCWQLPTACADHRSAARFVTDFWQNKDGTPITLNL